MRHIGLQPGQLLVKAGHEVDVAYNGEAALKKVQETGPFDLIFMDCQMPSMDGFGLEITGYLAPEKS